MKKNLMMRAASVLLVAVMLTTCAISGTFAKYVTSDNASDTARVAKFGVEVTATGTLFDKNYLKADSGNGPAGAVVDPAQLTVVSSNSDKLVAPGTKNTDGITFELTGTPEVDVRVDIVVTQADGTDATLEEIFLKATTGETLPNMTTGNGEDKFENASDYYPVKFTLVQTKNGGASSTLVNGGRLSAVETALEGLSANFDANTDLAGVNGVGTLKLTWEWDFDASGVGTYDKQDTLLGDLMAGTTLKPDVILVDGVDYNLTTGIKIDVKVTQID